MSTTTPKGVRVTPYYSDDAPVAYHYSRQGRNTMSYEMHQVAHR